MSNELAAHGLEQFVALCQQNHTPARLQELVRLFLTPEEQTQLGMRMLLVHKLLEGKDPQRKISDELGVSIATITRGSNNLKLLDGELKQYLLKLFKL